MSGIYNKEELIGIVTRMQQAGESEENIAAVIKEYKLKNPEQPGNQTGSSVDATAKPKTTASNQNDTVSQSETGSSDLQNNIAVQDNTRIQLPEIVQDTGVFSNIQPIESFFESTNQERLREGANRDVEVMN